MADRDRGPSNIPEYAKRPNAAPWPPILLGVWSVTALLLRPQLPTIEYGLAQKVAGALFIASGMVLSIGGIWTLRTERSNVLPNRPSTKLVARGAFRISRNPIYTGEILAFFGFAVWTGSVAFAAGSGLLMISVYLLGVRREERHMAARFGDEWRKYTADVRRRL